ncbi:Peptidyl-prolyl cis-trans isomerase C (PPIase C) (Parvulin) (Rotamase C) [Durusdinium trenchii]|uniref:Peptidyl-prolyl cis-trans isomerase n=1 Tax=Durusdinium trenchii TaxID=1381693 RepID=A0ABP0I3M4_9DINO
MATSWLLRLGAKSREPAIIIGELKFTYGHCFIVFCGLFVLSTTLFMLLRADADQRKIKSAAIRHILMKSETDILLAKDRLEKGETFARVAKALSKCPSAADGGDLGVFQPGELDPAFDRVAFNPKIPIGEVVGPVKTRFGYHLFKLEYRTGFDVDKSNENKKDN